MVDGCCMRQCSRCVVQSCWPCREGATPSCPDSQCSTTQRVHDLSNKLSNLTNFSLCLLYRYLFPATTIVIAIVTHSTKGKKMHSQPIYPQPIPRHNNSRFGFYNIEAFKQKARTFFPNAVLSGDEETRSKMEFEAGRQPQNVGSWNASAGIQGQGRRVRRFEGEREVIDLTGDGDEPGTTSVGNPGLTDPAGRRGDAFVDGTGTATNGSNFAAPSASGHGFRNAEARKGSEILLPLSINIPPRHPSSPESWTPYPNPQAPKAEEIQHPITSHRSHSPQRSSDARPTPPPHSLPPSDEPPDELLLRDCLASFNATHDFPGTASSFEARSPPWSKYARFRAENVFSNQLKLCVEAAGEDCETCGTSRDGACTQWLCGVCRWDVGKRCCERKLCEEGCMNCLKGYGSSYGL